MMEEDPEMYEAAGISSHLVLQTTDDSVLIQQPIESAIISVHSLQGANVVVKVCVIGNNHGTVNVLNMPLICSQYVFTYLYSYLVIFSQQF